VEDAEMWKTRRCGRGGDGEDAEMGKIDVIGRMREWERRKAAASGKNGKAGE
jgi:hypothetical protein